jgi:small-conductance mechanosensitive channel
MQPLDEFFLSLSTTTSLMAVFTFLGGVMLMLVFRHLAVKHVRHWNEQHTQHWSRPLIGLLEQIGWPITVLIPFFVATRMVDLPDIISSFLFGVVMIVVIVTATRVLLALVLHLLEAALRRSQSEVDETMLQVIRVVVRMVLWSIALLLVLQNLGYQVTALLGGLGIMGLAVGIALQNVLGDVFSFFSIYFDKPFKVGDFVVFGTDSGVVERIGIKSTRIRTLQGQELVVSNSALTSEKINNFRQMQERRVVFTLGVAYETPLSILEKLPVVLQSCVEIQDAARFDRAHLSAFTESNIAFEVVYHVTTREYDIYMDTQQAILLEVLKHFEKLKVKIAYPTRTIYTQSQPHSQD